VRARFLVPILCCALGLDGCAGLPPLEEATGGIPVREIVLRVKCELSDAFMLGEPGEPGWWLTDQPNFAWMKDWITQSDLTLEILDTAGFSPGVTLKQPLFNGWATSAGPATMNGTAIPAVPQSFAISAGASLSGSATRVEALSFVFSLPELRKWRESERNTEPRVCALSDKMDLAGRLGLKEWVAEALTFDLVTPADKSTGKNKTVRPPLTVMGQTLQFILSYTGSVSPTWTFVRFQGPNNPFFAAAGQRTHILNIAIGPSQMAEDKTSKAKTPGSAVTTTLSNLLQTILLPTRAP
jgi:hypothetical protein